MPKSDRDDERRQRARANAQDWAKNQEKGGNNNCIKLPKGIELYKFDKDGSFQLDFMLYVVGENNPRADKGMEHFEREYDAHRIPVADGKQLWPCRFKNQRKRCAVCDFLRDNGGRIDPELVKTLRATTRHLWLVNDKPGQKDNPLKILDTNHFNRGLGFGEMMADAIASVEAYADFADPKNGYTLQMNVKKQTFPGGSFHTPVRIDFLRRNYTYPNSIIDSAPCLDDLLVDPGFDDVMKLLTSGGVDDEKETRRGGEDASVRTRRDDEERPSRQRDEDEERPSRRRDEDEERPSRRRDEDEDKPKKKEDPTAEDLGLELGDMVRHPDHGKCKIVHISGDGTSLRLRDVDNEVHKAIAPGEVKKIKEEKDEEKPKRKEPDEDEDDRRAAEQRKKKDRGKEDDDRPKKRTEEDDDRPRKRSDEESSSGSSSRRTTIRDDDDDDERPRRGVSFDGEDDDIPFKKGGDEDDRPRRRGKD
jgi:hypothetical protein